MKMVYKPDRPDVGISVCVCRDDKVLLHKRKSQHAYGTWAFAGGHMEKWEDFTKCAIRELKEEAGEQFKTTEPVFWQAFDSQYTDEDKHVVDIVMVCQWIGGEPRVMEPDKCENWEWHSWSKLPSPLMKGLQYLVDQKLCPPLLRLSTNAV